MIARVAVSESDQSINLGSGVGVVPGANGKEGSYNVAMEVEHQKPVWEPNLGLIDEIGIS